MPRTGPLTPIFRPEPKKGAAPIGHQIGQILSRARPSTITLPISIPTPTVVLAPEFVGFPSTQSTGTGTTQVNLGYPSGIQDGDVVVVICRKDDAWGTLPSGFTEKHSNPYGIGNDISVVTGIYDTATHGANFTVSYAGGAAGLTRAILYACRNVSPNTAGFNSADDINGDDKFYPTLTTPGGTVLGFAFAFAGDVFTDEQHNGWTRDWDDGNTNSYTQVISTSGAQTMPRFDNVANAYLVTFYAAA